jgi:phage replication initiation protein
MNLPIDSDLPDDVDARAASGTSSVGSSPRVVTRGETTVAADVTDAIAFVDWLGFTVEIPAGQGLPWLENAVVSVFCVPRIGWADASRGWYGYKNRLNLGCYGLLAFGGAAQRGTYHVELNAHACRLIRDWKAVRVWGQTYLGRISRVDLAHDDLSGHAVSVSRARAWLSEGLFTVGGRPPRAELWDDLDSGRGKTLYVGSRAAGKLLRVYEKGKQLGEPRSNWVRVEVELRNKGRTVSWDTVTEPAEYLAGAYPVLGYLSAVQNRLRTTQRAGQITYEAMVRTLRTQGGKALGVMCQVHEGDAAGVLAEVVREGVPKRLRGFEDVLGQLPSGRAP